MMSIEQKIHQLIEIEMQDRIGSHLKSVWHHYQWCGYVDGNTFTVWKYSKWHGYLYPVIHGKIKAENDLELSYTLNPLGKILFVLWAIVIPLLIVIEPINQLINGNSNFWLFIVAAVVPVFFFLLLRYVQKRAMRIAVEEFATAIKS